MQSQTTSRGASGGVTLADGPSPPGVTWGLHAEKSPEQVGCALEELDLDCIKVKLMDKEEGDGWSRERADAVETLYRRFMYLTYFSERPIVPTHEIDAFWHRHILDTQKYAEDCDRVFGCFIHHFPYFGMRGPEDVADLNSAFEHSVRLYAELFDGQYTGDSSDASRCEGGKCGSACGAPHCKPKTVFGDLRPSLTT